MKYNIYLGLIIIIISIVIFYLTKKIFTRKNGYINLDEYAYENQNKINLSNKRKMWIHIPTGNKSKNWDNFNNKFNYINNDIILTCLLSIIKNNEYNYNILLFTDNDFENILDLREPMKNITDEQRNILCLAIIHKHGGVLIPCNFFMKNSFKSVDKDNTFYVSKIPNNGINVTLEDYVYSTELCGSNIRNPILLEYLNKIKNKNNLEFEQQLLKSMDIPFIDPKLIGRQDINNDIIVLDDLLEDKNISLADNVVGILIPYDELNKRKKHKWLNNVNLENFLYINNFLSKFIIENK